MSNVLPTQVFRFLRQLNTSERTRDTCDSLTRYRSAGARRSFKNNDDYLLVHPWVGLDLPIFFQGFTITLRHNTLGRTPLDE